MTKMEKLQNELKELKDRHVSLLDLMVYDEINCEVEGNISDEEFEKLFYIVKKAYLYFNLDKNWDEVYETTGREDWDNAYSDLVKLLYKLNDMGIFEENVNAIVGRLDNIFEGGDIGDL